MKIPKDCKVVAAVLAAVGLAAAFSPVAGAATLAYWPFGSAGLADASGNGHDLVATGVDLSGASAVLDGSQTQFNTAQTLDLSACRELTVEFWTKFKASDNPEAAILIEHSEDYNGNVGAFIVDVTPTAIDGYLRTSGWVGGSCDSNLANDDAWHHVALVLSDRQPLALYVDGTKVHTGVGYPLAGTVLADKVLYLGSRNGTTSRFKGEIDDVRISDVALTPDRFVSRSDARDVSAVIAYWPFGSFGNSDASGNGNDLASSGITFTDGSARFPGSGFFCMTRRPLDLRAYSSATVEFFVRVPSSSSSLQMLLEHSADIATAGSGTFYLDLNEKSEGSILSAVKVPQGHNPDLTGSVADGEWHHVALVLDSAASDKAALYLDGQLQTAGQADGGDLALRNAYLYLGSRANMEYGFAGELDDIRITGRALAPAEFLSARTTENDAVIAYWPMRRGLERQDESGNGHDAAASLDLTASGPVTVECQSRQADGWHHLARVYGNGASAAPTAVYVDGAASAGAEYADVCVVADGILAPQADFAATVDDVRVTAAALTPDRFHRGRTDETPRVLSHWSFTPGRTLEDETGLCPLGVLPDSRVGWQDGAARFEGSAGLVTKWNPELFSLRAYTVECLVRYPQDSHAANVLELSENYNLASGRFVISTQVGPNRPGFGFTLPKGYQVADSSEERPGDDAWHHWAMTASLSPEGRLTTAFYIDGVRQTNQVATSDSALSFFPFAGDLRLFFGCRGQAAGAGYTYDSGCVYRGLVDDVRISDAALTPEEMMTVADRTAVEQPVVAHWTFDGENPLEDKSGHGHALSGTATAGNGIASFDGTQYLTTVGNVDLTPYRQITVEAVLRAKNHSAAQIICEQSANYYSKSCAGAPLISMDDQGHYSCGIYSCTKRTDACPLDNDRWHHVAIVIDLDQDASASRVALYADGERDEAVVEVFAYAKDLLAPRNSSFCLGMRDRTSYPFTGDLREVRITARALTPREFLTLPGAAFWPNGGVVAYWPFDRDRPLADASGNGFGLVAPTSGVSFARSAAATFDGAGVGLSSATRLPLAALDKVTFEFWARAASAQDGLGLLYSGRLSGLDCAFGVGTVLEAERLGAVSRLMATAYSNNGRILRLTNDRKTPWAIDLLRGWHHYAFVYDRRATAAEQARLYVDGALQPNVAGLADGYGLPLVNSALCIGSDMDGIVPFVGQIDDVKVTADALTPDRFMTSRSRAPGLSVLIR